MAIIECTYKPDPAATPTVDGQTYHFMKDRRGRFVALVTDLSHIAILLATPHYREVDDEQADVDHVDEVSEAPMFKDETDDQVAERLRVERETKANADALQKDADKRAAEQEELAAAKREKRAPKIEIDPHTLNQMSDEAVADATGKPSTPESDVIDETAVGASDDGEGDEETIVVDDFTLITGIGETVQTAFYEREIYTYADLAALSDERVEELNTSLKMKNSMSRYDVRLQASKLADKVED